MNFSAPRWGARCFYVYTGGSVPLCGTPPPAMILAAAARPLFFAARGSGNLHLGVICFAAPKWGSSLPRRRR